MEKNNVRNSNFDPTTGTCPNLHRYLVFNEIDQLQTNQIVILFIIIWLTLL